jgi:hypothetical protein
VSAQFCTCQPPTPKRGTADVCECGGEIKESNDGELKSDIITPEQKDFARSLIGHQQQIILKSRRIIDDIKTQFGLKE